MAGSAGRTAIAVLAGAVLWAVLWIAGGQGVAMLFPEAAVAGQPVTHAGVLWGLIVYSVVLSVLAGYTTAAVGNSMRGVRVLAGVQLLLGIMFEAMSWSLTPVWYHLVFLLLLVPAVLYGGRLRAGSISAVHA